MTKREHQKRKYAVVRTDKQKPPKMDKEMKGKIANACLQVTIPVLTAGLTMIADPALGIVIVSGCVAALWSIAIWGGYFDFIAGRRVQYGGYAIVGLVAVILALLSRPGRPDALQDTNQPVITPPPVVFAPNGSGSTIITSQGQTGGITAQTVNNPVIHNYFVNQPPDEKEKWRQYLNKEYPLGWGLLASDGKTTYTPPGLSYEKDFEVRWSTAKVGRLTPQIIELTLPDFLYKPNKLLFTNGGMYLGRGVGSMGTYVFKQTTIVGEVLKDERNFIVMTIGFREKRQSDRRGLHVE